MIDRFEQYFRPKWPIMARIIIVDDDQVVTEIASDALNAVGHMTRCLIPRFDGAILSLEWKEAIWDRYVTGAPRPRPPSEQQYSDRKLRSRR